MTAVFISYRREGSKGFTGVLVRELKKRFGSDKVFIDYEDIKEGLYATGIQQAASAILTSDFSPIPPMSKLMKKSCYYF